jgi:HCOMODA/2-hydroxy-3-carboxy-muconic semialdehyde decarboxylase
VCGSVLAALGIVFVSACASEPAAPAADTAAAPAAAAHPDQATIDDMVVANRILSSEVGILDIQGHVTARSRVNPDHYFIARFIAPGDATTSDIIENDLDSNAVDGPRNDQARETYLHGEIFKARPDVMAIVHSHTAEFVAFSMSSVPLFSGENKMPVWDIRMFNKDRPGIVGTPALGAAMAKGLGGAEGVLLWGHGIALTSSTLPDLVSRAIDLRTTARVQQAVIARGGTWNPQAKRVTLERDPAATPTVEGVSGTGKTWEQLKQRTLARTGGQVPAVGAPEPTKPGNPDEATALDVAYANRILASDQVGVLDGFGHVSVRSPQDPNRYFIAAKVAPGAATPGDIVQRDMTQPGADSQGYSIHDAVYKARPDVQAILFARTPEIVAFTEGAERLRPVVNGGAFIGDGFPTFNLGRLDPTRPILANPGFGQGVADALGKESAVYVAGLGFVLTANSVYNLTDRAYALRQNALIQQQATALRGKVAHFDDRPAPPAPPAAAPAAAAPAGPTLGPPEGRAWVYWRDRVSFE